MKENSQGRPPFPPQDLKELIDNQCTPTIASSSMDENSQGNPPPQDLEASNLGSQGKTEISILPITTFTVGKWKRESTHEGNLNAIFSYTSKKVLWEFQNVPFNSKMEVSWSDITAIEAVMNPNQPGMLRIQLAKPPLFFQEIPPPPSYHPNWQTDDFPDGQALIWRVHEAIFPPGALDKHYKELLINDERLAVLSGMPFPAHELQFYHSNIIAAPASSNAVMGNQINSEPTFVDSSRKNRPLVPDQRLYQYCDLAVTNEPAFVDGSSSEAQFWAEVDDPDVVNVLGTVPSPPPPPPHFTPIGYQAKWKPDWSVKFKWANPVSPNGLLLVKCHVCCLNEKRGSNPFANDGAKSVSRKSLMTHEASMLHQESVELFADEVFAKLPTSNVPFGGPASNIPTAPLAHRERKNSTLDESLSNKFPWAFVQKDNAGEEHVLCKYCVSFAVKSARSSFASQGSATFTPQSLAYHANTTGHKEAVQKALASSNDVVMGNQINNKPAFVGGSSSEVEQNCAADVDDKALVEALVREADAVCDDDDWCSMIDEYMKQTDDHGNELLGGGNVNEASSSDPPASSPPSKP